MYNLTPHDSSFAERLETIIKDGGKTYHDLIYYQGYDTGTSEAQLDENSLF